jgi:hypothetical protein
LARKKREMRERKRACWAEKKRKPDWAKRERERERERERGLRWFF